MAKYAELSIYRQAANEPGYSSVKELLDDPSYHDYRGYEQFWKSEVNQIRLMADDEGDGRFYYSGMAQAVLLDQLMPDWKDRLFEDGVWLEDLLTEALK